MHWNYNEFTVFEISHNLVEDNYTSGMQKVVLNQPLHVNGFSMSLVFAFQKTWMVKYLY